ncbi:N-terminal EF-hand calcium-binding protein 1 isoform X3 [Saimiri boliviensis]|uniref:N-terminal EF-hand calcium-binding protein 1 isoform X3 n=1 Tax=Saimiri boliviensis TaxID=27679 RepID=UPI003D780673
MRQAQDLKRSAKGESCSVTHARMQWCHHIAQAGLEFLRPQQIASIEEIYLPQPPKVLALQILRRADKNDDGKLSFEEFKAYFADGVLSGEELHELFHTIDTHNTNNLDTEELCEYFSQHLGEYENVLAALEDLNLSILKAMSKTKKDYQEASNLEQFVTRFLLKETLNQLQSLQNSLECAMETTEEQTRQERQGPAKPEVLSIQWPGKRSSRRVQRHNSFSPNSPQFNVSGQGLLEEDNQWMTQINRLQKLIDRLEKKVDHCDLECSGRTLCDRKSSNGALKMVT